MNDKLRKRGIMLVHWCCMCRHSGESGDHVLLHFDFANALWGYVFGLLGVN